MINPLVSDRFEFAGALIREAGDLALNYFQGFDQLAVKSKGHQDMATEADLEVEFLVRNRIAQHFPGDSFLGEESGLAELDPKAGIWVVDPIDGTQPFVSGMTSWCVSIAFVRENILEWGLVYSPARQELFAGCLGAPATRNGQVIRVTQASRLADGIVGVGYSPRVSPVEFLPSFTRLLEGGAMFYREGSGALTLCYVACGRLIGYIEAHINSWDCLGALAVIRSAGGQINDFLANEGLRKGNRVIAGPASLYPTLLSLFDSEGFCQSPES